MTKIIVFSDIHIHPHKFGSTADPVTKRQSRLQHGLDVLQITAEAANDAGAVARIFCGDMFHVRGRMPPSIINPVSDHYREAGVAGWQDHLLPGNHDMEHRIDGEHALHVMQSDRVQVHDGYGMTYCDWGLKDGLVLLAWVAYCPNVTELRQKVDKLAADARFNDAGERVSKKILLIHHGVDGVIPGVPDCGFNSSHLPTDVFDFVFCGDYHTHKELVPGKAWMIGAPMQHNFGDAGQKRGYMVVDLETGVWEHREITEVPKFITSDHKGAFATVSSNPDFKGNFVRVRADDEAFLEAQADCATKMGAIAVQKELIRDWEIAARLDADLVAMSTSAMFRTWLDQQEVEEDDKPEIIAMNDEILAEAGVV